MAGVPLEESGAFEGQLGFVVTDGHFDLPAAGIGKDDLPSQLRGMCGLGSKQIPRGLVLASSDNQPERLVVGRVKKRKGNDPGLRVYDIMCKRGTNVSRERMEQT